jgi:AcrR family transcriptional regulator
MTAAPPLRAGPDDPTPIQDRAIRTRLRILAAATAVIKRDGASRLTLDKVATEAGVSKGGLLYHFGSKDDLIVGLLDQTLADAGAELDQRAAALGSRAGAFATAYLDYVRQPYQAATDSACSILAAAALDDLLLNGARGIFDEWQARLLADGLSPVTALLARIVGDGLWLIDLFGLAPPTAQQRTEVLDLVERLIDNDVSPAVGGPPAEGPAESPEPGCP